MWGHCKRHFFKKITLVLKFWECLHIPSNTQLNLIQGPNCSLHECLLHQNSQYNNSNFSVNIGTLLFQKVLGTPKIILPNYSIYESLTTCKNSIQ